MREPVPATYERIREAAARWREAEAAGTAREPDRPWIALPDGRVHALLPQFLAIFEEFAFLEAEGFRIATAYHDANEDRVIWIDGDGLFLDLGLGSCWIVMVGRSDALPVPLGPAVPRVHARELVPADIAATIPAIELGRSSLPFMELLPACAAWARAALAAIRAPDGGRLLDDALRAGGRR